MAERVRGHRRRAGAAGRRDFSTKSPGGWWPAWAERGEGQAALAPFRLLDFGGEATAPPVHEAFSRIGHVLSARAVVATTIDDERAAPDELDKFQPTIGPAGAYLLVAAGFLLLAGRVADLFGWQGVSVAATAAFATGASAKASRSWPRQRSRPSRRSHAAKSPGSDQRMNHHPKGTIFDRRRRARMPTVRTATNKATLRRLGNAGNAHGSQLMPNVTDAVFPPGVVKGAPLSPVGNY